MSVFATHRRLIVALAVLATVGAALLALTWTDDGRSPAAAGKEPPPHAEAAFERLAKVATRDPSDSFAIGRADAPVVIVEFSDFQCAYCGKWARETKPEVLKKYVDTGIARIEFRNYPIFGEESATAAHASYAAAQQGRFWQFHDLVYSVERKKNTGNFTPEKIVEMARQAGVPDLERFRTDLTSQAAEDHVAATAGAGYEIGVSSTPSFLVNGIPVLGAQPTDEFLKTIEQARARARTP